MPITVPKRWTASVGGGATLDNVTAHLCAMCSYFVYYANYDGFFTSSLGATKMNSIVSGSIPQIPQTLMFSLAECNIVVVAGTTNLQQIYAQVANPSYLAPMYCPSGVLGMAYPVLKANLILSQMEPVLVSLCKSAPTFFCGHSLGGAVALCLMSSLNARYAGALQQVVGYTFGCPRPGNKAFRNQLPPTLTVQVPGDVVPLLPPVGVVAPSGYSLATGFLNCPISDPFRTAGTPVWLDAGGDLYLCEKNAHNDAPQSKAIWDNLGTPELDEAINPALHQVKNVTRYVSEAYQHHLMAGYLKRLEAAIPSSGGLKPEAYADGSAQESALPPDPDTSSSGSGADFPALEAAVNVPPVAVDPGAVPLPHRKRH